MARPKIAGHSKYKKYRFCKDHAERREEKRRQIALLRELLVEAERAGEAADAARLARKLRLKEQELRYMTD